MSELSIMDDRMEDVDPESIPNYYFWSLTTSCSASRLQRFQTTRLLSFK
jgi:hypothetical protein